MLSQLVEQPGQTISSSPTGPVVIPANSYVDITEKADKGLRPQIGGHVNGNEPITVSKNLAAKLAEGDARIRAQNAARKAQEDALEVSIHETTPDKLSDRLGYLERTVKAQAKQIKELLKNHAEA